MIAPVSVLFALLGFAVFAARRLLTYLHLFQQEEYDNRPLSALDRRKPRLGPAAVAGPARDLRGAADPAGAGAGRVFVALAGLACFGAAAIERDPRKTAKKQLAMTARAKRIYGIALVACRAASGSPRR